MAKEAFLINPPRRLKMKRRAKKSVRRKRRNPRILSEKQIAELAPYYRSAVEGKKPRKKRRKTVAKRRRKAKTVTVRRRKRRRTVKVAVRSRRKTTRVRRRRRTKASRTRKIRVRVGRRVRKTGVVRSVRINRPRKRRRYRRNPIGSTLMIAGANPRRRRRHIRRHRSNPRRRFMRRNPASITLGSPFQFQKNLPYMLTGAASAVAVSMVPPMIDPFLPFLTGSPMKRIGLKFAVAVGGGFVLEKFLKLKGHGAVFALVGSGIAVADAISEYLLKPMGFLTDYTVSDYDVSDYSVSDGGYGDEGMDAFPDIGVGAFPNVDGY